MGLIVCPDCSNQVSDSASACPKCGRPMEAAENHGTTGRARPSKAPLVVAWIALAGMIVVIIIMLLSGAEADRILGTLVTFLLLIGGLGIYFIPYLTANARSHPNAGAIGALNFFLGWTLLAWVAALVWALTAPKRSG